MNAPKPARQQPVRLRYHTPMTTSRLGLTALLIGLLLAACAEPLENPPAMPLKASAEQLAQIPAWEPGPHPVRKSAALNWPVRGRELRLRIVEPAGAGPYPLILFSHGFASDIDEYDALLDHWASHGFVSIAPYHRDGGGSPRAIFNSLRYGTEKLISARIEDLRLILDHLVALEQVMPGLPERIDARRIAAAGHSFGAFSAQQLGGAIAIDPDTGQRIEGRDARIQAVLALSPPGEMFGLINRRSWLDMDLPMLATTGTWDRDGRFVTDWRQHRLSYDTARPGQNWLLVIDGADHYLGRLICRTDRDAAPQTDALRMINASAVNFFRSQLLEQAEARKFLAGQSLDQLSGGFARLSHR